MYKRVKGKEYPSFHSIQSISIFQWGFLKGLDDSESIELGFDTIG